jgi:hypothetical protein
MEVALLVLKLQKIQEHMPKPPITKQNVSSSCCDGHRVKKVTVGATPAGLCVAACRMGS